MMQTPGLRRRRHPPLHDLSRYLEGEISVRERRKLESHLLECRGCRQMLRSIATTVRALASLPAPSSAGLADAIISSLRVGEPGQSATEPLIVEGGVGRHWRR